MPKKTQPARRYLASIEKIQGTQDALGQEIKTWVTFVTAWVSIEQLSGFEHMALQQLYAGVNCRLHMYWQSGIVPKMRVTYTAPEGTRHFDINAAVDPDGKRRRLQLLCTERVESGQAGE